MRIVCNARQHGTEHAVRFHGCKCPDGVELRRARRGRRIPGHTPPGKQTPGSSERWIVEQRLADTRRLTAAGHSATDIALRLGVSHRHVQRYRAILRARAA